MLDAYFPNEYLRAFVVFVIFFFGTKVLLFFGEKIALKLTSKTKTNLDDLLLERMSKPMTFLAFLISLRITISEVTLTLGVLNVIVNMIYSIIVVTIAYLFYVIVDLLVINGLKKLAKKTKSDMDDSLISLFRSVMDLALIVVCLLYILNLWGIQIVPLLAGLGVAGIAVALALQPILSNIFSGASIILDHTVKVDDLVKLDEGTCGIVKKVGLRSTKIITFDNETIIVPNTKLAESIVQNIALPEPSVRVVIPFSVAYGSDIEKVKKIVLNEIMSVKHASKEKGFVVRFLEMADSGLNFKAYFYVDSFENRVVSIDEANTKIYNALNKAKIEIPFPQMDVHLRK